MPHRMRTKVGLWLAAFLCVAAVPVAAQPAQGKIDPDGLTMDKIREAMPEYFAPRGDRGASPEALPDIFGPGAVLRVGNIQMKVTNWGHNGDLFYGVTSTDPSGQWPGASGIEYLSSIRLMVGGVNPRATAPEAIRRVSYLLEWRPQTLDPEDKIYRAYDGIVNGSRLVNDDGDFVIGPTGDREPAIDEDFLDGRDNDGDGKIDEDYGALGQEMYSCVMWDNTIQAINTAFNEKHVPLGLECRQLAWAYSIRGYQDFNVMQYEIYNRSGHTLDSVVVGYLVDMDCGPLRESNFFQDDFDLPHYPFGDFLVNVGEGADDLHDTNRRQDSHDPTINSLVPAGQPLCPSVHIRVNGFSIADDNGDNNLTLGVPSFFLIDMNPLDPTPAHTAPAQVGWRAYRSFTAGTPYTSGGNPTIDQQRFEFMTGTDNVDQATGFVTHDFPNGELKGDYVALCSVGPWRNVPDGGKITVTVGFGVQPGTYAKGANYLADYDRFQSGFKTRQDLLSEYPSLANCFAAELAFEGVNQRREGFPVTDYHGRETGIRLPLGSPQVEVTEDCSEFGRELRTEIVTDREYKWFDFDCNYCTGVWQYPPPNPREPSSGGMYHVTWNAQSPPPSPNLNVSATYNFSDNPDRRVAPARDHGIMLAWDNASEVTPDPKTGWFDFRGYKIWKVSDWTRPVGSAGPAESDWRLLGEFRIFDYFPGGVPMLRNYSVDTDGTKHCPRVFVPNRYDPVTNSYVGPDSVTVCLDRGDLWDKQSGRVIRPDTSFHCISVPGYPDSCDGVVGCILRASPCSNPSNQTFRPRFPIGRYQYLDTEVKNGFMYFYSVTAFDSVSDGTTTTQFDGRRSGVEAEGVAPQVSAGKSKVWVVPNPYRGYARLGARPSAWDLTPNASDPTGTHIDFLGLPREFWTIKIFTVAGDLVAVIHSTDAVNESIRPEVRQELPPTTPGGPTSARTLPGYNRQQDNPNDGQASWNLISRNGQDVVSGIYLFTVESKSTGTQRGRFVIIR